MFVQTQITPNPNSLKFLPGEVVSKNGSYEITKKDEIKNDLVRNILSINGVTGVFLGNDFITVSKNEQTSWEDLKPNLIVAITDHYNSNQPVINTTGNFKKNTNESQNSEDTEIVKQIKELLDTRVRPSVAMDGGDIIYKDFQDFPSSPLL